MAARFLPYLAVILLGILGWGIGLISTLRAGISRQTRYAWVGLTVASAATALASGLLMAEAVLPRPPTPWITLLDAPVENP